MNNPRFKVGDKVVCINIENLEPKFSTLEYHHIYTVDFYDGKYTKYVYLHGLRGIYSQYRFILLSEFRREKIKSLYNT